MPVSASIAFRVCLCEEPAGNDPVFMAAHERAPDVEKHPAFTRVGMPKDPFLHVRIGRSRFMAFRAEKRVRVVFQPEIDARSVFGMLDSCDLPVLRKLQHFLIRFSCRHSAAAPLEISFTLYSFRKPVTITRESGFVKFPLPKKESMRLCPSSLIGKGIRQRNLYSKPVHVKENAGSAGKKGFPGVFRH